MDKKAILELKKRITIDNCSFTKIAACYVDHNKDTVTKMNQKFLTLDSDEMFKYLGIAEKVFDKKIKDKFLTLDIESGTIGKSLLSLRDSELDSDEILESFYEQVKENLDTGESYLIVLYKDTYDVMKRTSDGNELDESEEVYEYIIGAICPVSLSKAGLGYNAEKNKITNRVRDWVVASPEIGFVYPAFVNRSADLDKVGYYIRNPKEPHEEFMKKGLGCRVQYTATQYKLAFEGSILRNCKSAELTEEYIRNINNELNIIMQEQGDVEEDITEDGMCEILKNAKVPEDYSKGIIKDYMEMPERCKPSWLFTPKQLALYEQQERKDHVRKLLNQAANELLKNGPSDTADDIVEYLDKTR